MAFVAIIALIFLGPKKLPELARSIGSGMREFRESMSIDHDDTAAQLPAVPAADVPVAPVLDAPAVATPAVATPAEDHAGPAPAAPPAPSVGA
jgi:TatA/E family protein of Tat protein translocase